MMVDLAPGRAGGLRLQHPVMVAAGGAGYGDELLAAVGDVLPGAIVTRSVTRGAQPGNPPPRMVALDEGLLSSVGLHNPGLDAVLRRRSTRWGMTDVPIIISICGADVDDITALARTVDQQPGIAGLELNLACPDRSRRGEPIGLDVAASEIATVAARAATDQPLIVKLPTVGTESRAVARVVAAAGADAISAGGQVAALAIADDRLDTSLGTAYGGLSGPAIKTVALRAVYEIAQVVRIPIIGCGGVATLDDVRDYLAAGATAVGMATAVLADPQLPGRLGAELHEWCAEHGVSDARDLIGTALPERKDRGSLRRGPFRC